MMPRSMPVRGGWPAMAVLALAMVALAAGLLATRPARADEGYHGARQHGWHHGPHRGWYRPGPYPYPYPYPGVVVVAPPPVVYAPPPVVYAPPPVVYAPVVPSLTVTVPIRVR